ncbi:hypothetical protein QUF70_06310 [Desulfobacterales bacterium HSG17]|nr:hypothetical protein [Desulfobacterales bacterium HSG17]
MIRVYQQSEPTTDTVRENLADRKLLLCQIKIIFLYFIIILLSLMILLPNHTYAYFQSKGDQSSFLKSGYQVKENTNVNTFVLYDGFNTGKIDKEQILFAKSKFFISADLTSLSFPLSIGFYSYTSTDNTLADFLYANLKMKKLVVEYQDIQEKSKILIWDSQHLFEQSDNTGSVYQASRRVKESSLQVAGDAGAFFFSQANTLVSNRIRTFRPLFDHNRQLTPNFKTTVGRGDSNNNITVQGNGYEDSDEDKIVEKRENILRTIRANPYRNTSEPFIIRFFTKLTRILPYFIAHKGEAVFYGIGLTLILLVFSTILKR